MALPSNVAQTSPRLRAAYTKSVGAMAGLIEAGVESQNGRSSRELALALAALCVGAMVIARTTDDDVLSSEVREAARSLASDLIR